MVFSKKCSIYLEKSVYAFTSVFIQLNHKDLIKLSDLS